MLTPGFVSPERRAELSLHLVTLAGWLQKNFSDAECQCWKTATGVKKNTVRLHSNMFSSSVRQSLGF